MQTAPFNQGLFSIDSLPNELLSEIFREYVALDYSPWLLASISKKWNGTVFGQPNLWTHIVVNDTGYGSDEKWEVLGKIGYSKGRASVCRNIEEVKDTVRRTGALPLHLRIVLGYTGAPALGLMALVGEVLCPTLAQRTVELHISITDSPRHSQVPLFGSFPALKVLHVNEIPTRWMPSFLQAIFSSPKSSLLSFRLPKGFPRENMEEIITSCPNLERLDNWPSGWPQDDTPNMTAPRLRDIIIGCSPRCLFKLRLPRLQSLLLFDLGTPPLHDTETLPPLDLPHLIELRVTSCDTRWLEFLSVPSLQTLALMGVDRPAPNRPDVHLLSPGLFPTVTSLSYETRINQPGGVDPEDTLLISTLQAVPNANSVRVKMWRIGNGDTRLRTRFLERLASRDEGDVLCPRLQDLELVSVAWRREDPGPLGDADASLLQRLVDARRKLGHELSQCVIKWRKPSGDMISKRFGAGTLIYNVCNIPDEFPKTTSPSVEWIWEDGGLNY